jgi:hypothetical protein
MNFIEGAGISKSLFISAATIPSRKNSRVGLVKFEASIAKLLLLIIVFFYLDLLNFNRMPEGFDLNVPSS